MPCTGAASTWACSRDELRFVEPPFERHHPVDLDDGNAKPEGPRRLGDGIDVDDRGIRGVHGEPLLNPLAEVAATARIEHDLHGEGTIDEVGETDPP